MSSSTAAQTTTWPDADAPVPLTRLVRVETRKMLDTRAGIWLLAVIVLLTVLVVGAVAWFADEGTSVAALILAAGAPQGLLLPVLGILLVTSEWSQRSAMSTFVLVPRRERVVVAKVLAALLVGLAVLALTIALAILAALAAGADLDVGSRLYAHYAVLQVLNLLQGLALGALLLNSAGAIVGYYLLPILSGVLFGVVRPLADLAPWLDPSSAQSPLSADAALTGEQWAQLASASALWIALPLALGTWRMLVAEVT